jgi:hypothetical protein
MTAPVKNYLSTDTGAPTWNGTIGATIAVLDALLINGFNEKTLSSLTQVDGVATATTATAHGYRVNQVVEIAGANEAGYNGQFPVLSVSTLSFTFAVDPATAAAATGTVTAKVAPLGWTKAFSGTNKAAYRSNDVAATQCLLRVDDSNALYSLVRGYKTMTDIDTGADPFPTTAQQANYAWKKSSTADATARKWALFGDDMLFMFALAYSTASGNAPTSANFPPIFGFGDFISYKPGDAFNCLIYAYVSTAPSAIYSDSGFNNTTNIPYCPRAFTQIGTALRLLKLAIYPNSSSGLSSGGLAYPNPEDNGLLIWNRHVLQDGASDVRGIQPGAYHLPQVAPMADGDVVSDVEGYAGKSFFMLGCSSNGTEARMAIDITGPWR